MKRWKWIIGLLVPAMTATAADNGLHKHRLDATVHVGAVDLGPAKFELACSSGKGANLSLTLILMKPDGVKNFPLNDFEGPDGIGGSKGLAEWAVDTRGPSITLKTGIGGWYGVDGDGFVLSSNGDAGKSSPIADFVRQVVDAKSQRLRLQLNAPHGGEPLQASVMLDGAQAELAKTAADCLVQ
jgi:hypothetical protein